MRKKYDLTQVFTPSMIARVNFIERESVRNQLTDAMRTPGKQIIVYGHTGSGKTTVVMNKLYQIYEEQIVTRCTSSTTCEQILLNAFDSLDPFYLAGLVGKKRIKIAAAAKANYFGLKHELTGESERQHEDHHERVLPPQLTMQRLAALIGEARCCWVLEDFHKVPPIEKQKIAQGMKLFTDMSDEYPDLKIIALGAVNTAREVIELDPEMKNRVAEVEVPLMSSSEIRAIIIRGAKLLNISLQRETQTKIIALSNGLAATTHQLCMNICRLAEINQTAEGKHPYPINISHSEEAVRKYIEGEKDSIKATLAGAMKSAPNAKYLNCRLILSALAEHDSIEGLSKNDLFESIRNIEPDYSYSSLSRYVNELCTVKRNEVLQICPDTERVAFVNPFHKAYLQASFQLEKKDSAKKRVQKSGEITLTFKVSDLADVGSDEILLQAMKSIRREHIDTLLEETPNRFRSP